MNFKRILLLIIGILFIRISILKAQNQIKLPPGIRLPFDTLVGKQIISSIKHFINQKNQENKSNEFVLPSDLVYTSILLDELKGMDTNQVAPPISFNAYVNNILKLSDSVYLIQLSYMAIQGDTPILRALYNIVGKKEPGHFVFTSPLLKNTYFWKTKTIANTTFHFRQQINLSQAESYVFFDSFYNAKLKIKDQQTHFYGADNFPDALQLIGVAYKMDYNGYNYNSLTSFENNIFLRISVNSDSNFPLFDPHDMWHEKLRTVVSNQLINRPVDEGCAYLYGGSWGMSWKEILTSFLIFAKANPNTNWLESYKNGSQFVAGNFPNPISAIINALFIKKLEKDNGFDSVMLLIMSGPREKGDANYFSELEKLTGITQAGFNKEVWRLITQSELGL